MPTNVVEGPLQELNEIQGRLVTRPPGVVINDILNVLARDFSGDDQLGFQAEPLFLTRSRSALK